MGTSVAAYGAGAALVAGGCALAGEAKGATPVVSPDLTRLIALYDEHDARLLAFYRDTFNPAQQRHYAMLDALPHVEADGSLAGDGRRIWSTSRRLDVAEARGIATMPTAGQSITPLWLDKRRRARSFYAASLRRDRAVARAERSSGAEAAAECEDRMQEAIQPTLDAIHHFPVASAADLAAKLAFVERAETIELASIVPIVTADVQRLCSGETSA
jgi:hypothetical protein